MLALRIAKEAREIAGGERRRERRDDEDDEPRGKELGQHLRRKCLCPVVSKARATFDVGESDKSGSILRKGADDRRPTSDHPDTIVVTTRI